MVEKKSKNRKETTQKVDKNASPPMSYGSIVFGVGLLIALVSSFLEIEETAKTIITSTLLVLGLIIGILNISNKEVIPFLLAVIVFVSLLQPFMLVVVQTLQISDKFALGIFGNIFANLMLLLVPAAIVVALKVIFIVARDE